MTTTALRTGFQRGLIELRHSFSTVQDLWGYFFPTVVFLVVMTLMKGSVIPGTTFSRGSMTLPSLIGASIGFNAMVNTMQQLTLEREDGTLLRAKALPHGMGGYLVGKIVLISGMTIAGIVLLIAPGLFLFDGLQVSAMTWVTLVWVLVLGLVATLPIGAVFGSLFENPRTTGVVMLPVMALVGTSGIFYPINALPEWVRGLAQVFPLYWLGLGMRSAFLPDAMAAVEIDGSWRTWETVGVLGAWAVAGLVLAPVVLRRMARRESGSSVAARREKALQRVPG
ncbi:ABC transporter permease [Amycolatopsis thermophila]|uniref:ABC-2 type transport system permease protein n=1 Tax=Amycolatopsis thermophila TaxID=206084 RepID=A0ABU0EW75_9PSEU|nr:ABC transporter permease [Amycolatopsis thermophila]MDQ0379563.1 ABC-2 type transport system permease protein [Amycolatopsis thermophila]